MTSVAGGADAGGVLGLDFVPFMPVGGAVDGRSFLTIVPLGPLPLIGLSPERCVPGPRGEDIAGEDMISRCFPLDLPYFGNVRVDSAIRENNSSQCVNG